MSWWPSQTSEQGMHPSPCLFHSSRFPNPMFGVLKTHLRKTRCRCCRGSSVWVRATVITANEFTEYLQHDSSSCIQSQGHSPATQWVSRIVNPVALVTWGGNNGRHTGCCLARIMGGVSPQHKTQIQEPQRLCMWQTWDKWLKTVYLLLCLGFSSFSQI